MFLGCKGIDFQVFKGLEVGAMILVFCSFGLIQKNQKIKAGPAGPELRYGTRKNGNSLRYAPLKQSIFLIACLRFVLDGPPAQAGFFFFRSLFLLSPFRSSPFPTPQDP